SVSGLLPALAIYNRSLSTNEIQAIYNAGAAGKCAQVSPFIVSQPTNQTVTAGLNTSFSVQAGGTGPLYYQWSLNGTNVSDGTSALLTLTNVQVSQAGNYSVQVTNAI